MNTMVSIVCLYLSYILIFMNLYFLFCAVRRKRQTKSVKNSVTGITDQIPVTPNAIGSRNTRTAFNTIPLIIQINREYPGFITDWKYVL